MYTLKNLLHNQHYCDANMTYDCTLEIHMVCAVTILAYENFGHLPTKRTVLRRKELKLHPPALMLPSFPAPILSLDCMQYPIPSPIII